MTTQLLLLQYVFSFLCPTMLVMSRGGKSTRILYLSRSSGTSVQSLVKDPNLLLNKSRKVQALKG